MRNKIKNKKIVTDKKIDFVSKSSKLATDLAIQTLAPFTIIDKKKRDRKWKKKLLQN